MCFPVGVDMASDTVTYSIDDLSNILTELSDIQNAMNNLQKQFDFVTQGIENSRRILHQLPKNEDLP